MPSGCSTVPPRSQQASRRAVVRSESQICLVPRSNRSRARICTERVSARSPGPRLLLSVTLSIGIAPRPTFDSAPVGLVCRRPMGRWSRFLPRPNPAAARAHHAGTYARNAADENVSCGSTACKARLGQYSASRGATVTRSSTAPASCRSSVISASAWSWVSATYSASKVSGHPSRTAAFHATP